MTADKAIEMAKSWNRKGALSHDYVYEALVTEVERLRAAFSEALSRIRAYRDNCNEGWDMEDDTRAALFALVNEEPCGPACAGE